MVVGYYQVDPESPLLSGERDFRLVYVGGLVVVNRPTSTTMYIHRLVLACRPRPSSLRLLNDQYRFDVDFQRRRSTHRQKKNSQGRALTSVTQEAAQASRLR